MAKGKARKEQTQKLLATVVMGMNLVNTVAPMAALAVAEPQTQLPQPAAGEAQPLDYAVLPQALDYLDRAVFATAEATSYGGNDSVASMVSGDSQNITAGQSGTVGTMSGGEQAISSGGSGTVGTNSGGSQYISAGGSGTVGTNSGGTQYIYSGGNGTVSTMSGGKQDISGGSGTVITLSDGVQDISSGNGTVSTMYSGGWQNIEASSASGTISTMSGGGQAVLMYGSGMVSAMYGGTQIISYGGIGSVVNMYGGTQIIDRYGSVAVVVNMYGGVQNIGSGYGGTVSALNGGRQDISSGGNGTVSTMNGGWQDISSGGNGTVSTMSGGTQDISSGGNGTVITLSGGVQFIRSSGSGTVSTMSGAGEQAIIGDGKGTVSTMSGGTQTIYSGGSGTVSTMSVGRQDIRNGGSGTVGIMSGGTQYIYSAGSGTVSALNGGTQTIRSGGTSLDTVLNSGGTVYQKSGGLISGIGYSGGVQIIDNINAGYNGMTLGTGAGGTNVTMGVISGAQMSGTILNNGGMQMVLTGGTSLDTVLNSGGTVYQYSGGLISGIGYSGGVQIIDNITAGYDNMTLGSGGTNVTMGVISGAQMSGTVLNSGGMQMVLNGGTALATEIKDGTMYFASGGVVSDLTMSGGVLELENVSGGSFNISGTMSANNGSIDMTASSVTRAPVTPTYESLTINKLQGSGNTFIMDTDLAGGANSDKVTITSADVGTHYVQIRDLSLLNSAEVKGERQQLLITDTSGKLTFAGKELNLGGLFEFDPTLTNGGELGKSANDWYLTAIKRNINNDTQVLLDAADNSYALWRNTNDSLRSRLGALGNGSERADGIWARTQAGRFSGSGYEGRYNLYQLGYDQKADAGSTYGFAVDYGDGSGTYDPGSGKDKLTAFSLYGVWQGAKGTYTNVTARAGIFDTDLDSYGANPDKASYKQHAYSVSVEYGQRFDYQQGLFFEPQAQFTLGRLSGISYTTNRGANGYIEGMNSAIGRIGFVMGQKIKNGSDIYLKADLLHEFAGKRDLQLTSEAGGTNDILSKHNDYGDTWFELGLGANIRLSKDSSFYGEVERGFGGDINKKWSVNAGLRFTF